MGAHINANLLTKEMVIWSKLKCNIYLYNIHRGISYLLKKGKIWLRNFKPVIFTEECVHHYTYLPLSKRDKDR